MPQLMSYSFYLNYVGCKVVFREDTVQTIICFTLTMWDVKATAAFETLSSKNGFYLNYVGCKAKTWENMA